MISANDIETAFGGFLTQIADRHLREKVVAAWVQGCKQGGWDSIEQLRKMPFTLLTDCQGVDFISHTCAVTQGAIGLARGQEKHYDRLPYPLDFDYLVAGGLLHDVGKLLEFEPDGAGGFRKTHSGRCARHPVSGAIMAAQAGVPEEVINIIACHSKEGDGRPKRIETILIHQADFASFDPLVMLKKGDLIV